MPSTLQGPGTAWGLPPAITGRQGGGISSQRHLRGLLDLEEDKNASILSDPQSTPLSCDAEQGFKICSSRQRLEPTSPHAHQVPTAASCLILSPVGLLQQHGHFTTMLLRTRWLPTLRSSRLRYRFGDSMGSQDHSVI